jgi:hypothetical protein
MSQAAEAEAISRFFVKSGFFVLHRSTVAIG